MTTVTVAQKRLVRFQDLVSGEGERNSNSNNNNTDRLPILPLPQNTQRNRNESPLLFSPLFAHQPPKLLHSIFSPASLKAGENVAVSRVALSGICLNLDPGGEDFDENESQLQSQSAQQPKYYVFQTNAGTGGPFLGPFDSNRRPIPNHSPIHRHGQNGYENQNYKYNYSRFAGQENEPPKSNAHAPTRTIAVSGSKINTTRSVRNLPMSPLFQVPAPVGGTRDVKIDRSAYRYELEQQQLQVQLKSQPKNPKSTTGRPNSNFNSKSLDVTTILLTPSSTDLSSLANSMESNLFDSSRSFFQTPQSHDHHSPPTSLLQLPVRPTTPALTVASFPTLEKSDWLSFDFISQCDRASQLVRITTALQSPRNNNMYPSLLRAAQNRLTQLHQLQHHHQECTDRRFEATPISDNSDSDSDSSSLVMSISTTTIDAFASDVGNAHFTTDSADIYPRRGSAHHAASYLSSPSVVPHSTPSTTFRRTASTVGCSKQELLRMIHEGNHQNAQLKKEMEHLSAVHNQHIEQQAAKMEVQNNYLDSSGWTEAAKRQLEATQAEHSIDRNRLEQQKQSLSALLTTAQADIVRLQKDLDVLLRAMQLAVESEMEVRNTTRNVQLIIPSHSLFLVVCFPISYTY